MQLQAILSRVRKFTGYEYETVTLSQDGKHDMTLTYRWFPAEWGWRLSWAETAAAVHTSWRTVFRSVRSAVMCRRNA
jgi:hypothetical protein